MADDDMCLASLAKPKGGPKFDDDAPLASLASLTRKPKPAGASGSGASPAKAGRPSSSAKPGAPRASPPKSRPSSSGQPGQKRKAKAGSDSDSSTSSDSDSSSSDDTRPVKKAGKGGGKGKSRAAVKAKKEKGNGSDEEGKGSDDEDNVPVKRGDRSVKELVAAELLCRWWYVLPDWPPTDESYYNEQLKKRSLRKVTIQEWEWVDETDKNGMRKCYELSAYRGLVRDSAGELIDLRPQDTCPCFANMMKKDLPDLYMLLVKAYETQLEELKKSRYDETQLRLQLQAALVRARKKAHEASGLTGNARKTLGT